MKKRVLSVLLGAAMVTGMMASTTAFADSSVAEASSSEVAADTQAAIDADEGKVLNIQCWNTEFQSRVKDHFPGYVEVDETTGQIGDVTVKWTITPSDDNAYQNNLDSVLPGNADAAADDKVDLFLVEADYALKYVNAETPVAMSLDEMGIDASALDDQYQYTKDIVTDSEGNQRGASWQACSAGLIYNREAAKAVLGSDDPETVQEAVKDWDAFNETAAKMKEAGYTMCSVNDTYRVYSNNVSQKWVNDDNQIVIDDNIKAWVDDSKALVDAGEENTYDLWGDDWSKGFYPDGNIFCYFGPAWFFNFSMAADTEGSIGNQGGWGFVVGPQSFYWGGTWICGAEGSDNVNLVANIITKMTTDQTILKEIATADSDCVNSKTVLADLASSEDGNLALLGGQNPYAVLAEGAENVDMSNISNYDQGCNESMQSAMKDYFEGNSDYDTALQAFYTAVQEKYPELTVAE